MKILFVSPYLHPEGGGVGRFVYKLAKELSTKNNISIVCSGKYSASANLDGMDFHFLKPRASFQNTPLKFRLLPTLDRLLKENDFDLVQAFTPVPYFADMAAIAARKNKVPFFLSYNSFNLKRNNLFLDPIIRLYQKTFEKFTLDSARKIILYNKNLSDSDIFPMHRHKLEFITPGVDKSVFAPALSSSDYFLFVGALNKGQHWKGLNHLFEAIKILNSRGIRAKLKVVGDGNLLNHFKTLSKKMDVDEMVDFEGFLNDKELAEAYNGCISLVLPSFTNAELMPFVITEAFACGKPVIASGTGGIPYIVDRWKNGLLVNPQKPEELANMMELLIRDSRITEILGRNALASAESFGWHKTAKEVQEIYKRAI